MRRPFVAPKTIASGGFRIIGITEQHIHSPEQKSVNCVSFFSELIRGKKNAGQGVVAPPEISVDSAALGRTYERDVLKSIIYGGLIESITSLGVVSSAAATDSTTFAADGNEPVQMKLYKSLRLWAFYVDLEESLGTLESTHAVYERILDLRIATPQIIINYALLLEEHKYFEDAFKVYERGVQIFKYPHVKDIWVTYLTKFVNRLFISICKGVYMILKSLALQIVLHFLTGFVSRLLNEKKKMESGINEA
ncbi:hypothetical protein NE237_000716 [Protea cynaroides]|uniref:Pre-mRNA-splicing factor Syf1/CRNKL1-like C-terminal HAT-repeats domain-containing protein n=1 Tax=Protea cynaroides TaxID=273540 RepID=A0A9Q0QXE4_9MAGN|nr:hypothetical protein NE237_000716 [Protea cynaroides]